MITNLSLTMVWLLLSIGILVWYTLKQQMDRKRIHNEIIRTLSFVIETKDAYTEGHSSRVKDYAYELGKEMGLTHASLENLKLAAILHDIGKIGIDEKILNKPAGLTTEEYSKIKKHPEMGVNIIRNISFLREASDIILSHHERCDGTGYPMGRINQEISVESAILCIADVFDALTSDRPYRKAMSVQQALDIINEGKGQLYQERVAETFINVIQRNNGMKILAG